MHASLHAEIFKCRRIGQVIEVVIGQLILRLVLRPMCHCRASLGQAMRMFKLQLSLLRPRIHRIAASQGCEATIVASQRSLPCAHALSDAMAVRSWARAVALLGSVFSLSSPADPRIGKLLRDAGVEGPYRATELESGFCNDVFRVDADARDGAPVVVKLFSGMAKARCDAACRGVVDVAVGAAGLGPEILLRTEDALVCEFVAGAEIDEAAVHANDCALAVDVLAPKLRRLHALPSPPPLPRAPAALWRGVDAMLGGAGGGPIALERLEREAARMRRAVGAVAEADVLGHGDLKPSNVMLGADGAATFIDFELAGPNYRGYDIFKLFRTAGPSPVSDQNLGRFVEAYLGETASASAVDHVRLETRLFEPLTWLEAAIFFSFASVQLPEKRSEMAALAADRWRAYEAVAGGAFDANVRALERHAAVERR